MSVVRRALPALLERRVREADARPEGVRAEARRPRAEDERAPAAVRVFLEALRVVREADARDVDRRCAAVFPALADALFCVRAAAIGAQSVV